MGRPIFPDYKAHCRILPNGCWEWARPCTHRYPRGTWNGIRDLAHRHVYRLTRGPIPDGMEILHSCDNGLCLNPDHLRAGTHQENMREAAERGLTHVPEHKRKLSDHAVREIRRRAANGELPLHLAREFGVNHAGVYRLLAGRRLAYVK
jgi:hypothetical protein